MKALIQRVSSSSVETEGQIVGKIGHGLLVFLAVEPFDDETVVDRMLRKILNYRVFSDADGKMNLSLKDKGFSLLVVSQFTLAADTRKGLRPSFSTCGSPALGEKLYDSFVKKARNMHIEVATGRYGSDMQVTLVNDGPVTFHLSVGHG